MPIRDTPQQFEADLRKFAEKVEIDIDTAMRLTALQVYEKTIRRTPVDTGRLRASWFMTRGSPSGAVAAEGERSEGQSLSEALSHNNVVPDRSGNPRPIFAVNNLSYAETVELGGFPAAPTTGTFIPPSQRGKHGVSPDTTHVIKSRGGFSKQAPQGMLRISLAEVLADIQSRTIEL